MVWMRSIVGLASLLALATAGQAAPSESSSSEGGALAAAACVRADLAYLSGELDDSAADLSAFLDRAPDNYEIAWRLARVHIAQGNLAVDGDSARAFFEAALRASERAIVLDSLRTEGFTCEAIASGSLSGHASGRDRIALAERAREAAVRALALDPDNHLALLVLGIWHREIATIGRLRRWGARLLYGGLPEGASLQESERLLRRAAEVAPDHLNHHRELAITLEALGRTREAADAYARALALPPTSPEDRSYLEDCRRRWRELQERGLEEH